MVAPLTASINALTNDLDLRYRAAEALGKLGDLLGGRSFNSHYEATLQVIRT